MGLFNFFKKGPAADDTDELQVKGTAYDTTARALPPIRGTLPVQGNGPNSLHDLQRSAKLRSDAQLSINSSAHDASLPSPRMSRFRSMSLGRPSTAPGSPVTNSPGPQPRPKTSSRNRDASKVQSFVTAKKRAGPPYLLGMTGPDDDDDDTDGITYGNDNAPPPVPPIASHFKQLPFAPDSPSLQYNNSPVRTAGGASSISESIGSGPGRMGKPKGHVDILDAQGALKPSDFKTRIKAAGARDYGEDVADRNMGVNGVNLNSPAVMAFYALTGGDALAYKSDGSAVDVHGNTYTPGNIPPHLLNQSTVGKDEVVAQANQNMRVPRFPARTTSLEPRSETSRPSTRGHLMAGEEEAATKQTTGFDSDAARRRMSVHGSALPSSKSQPKARPLSMHPTVFSDFRVEEAGATVPDIPRSRPTTSEEPPEGEAHPKTQTKARDSVVMAKKKRNGRSRSRGAKSARSATQTIQRATDSEADESSDRQRSHSAVTARRRKHSKSRGDESSYSSYGTIDAIPPLPFAGVSSRPGSAGRYDSRPQSQRSWKAPSIGQISTSSTATTPTDSVFPPSSRPSSSSSHPRNRSIGNRTQLHDITEHIPNRRSSLSISSSIPSSSLSSNPFPRPHSRHTADTSLDLGYTLPLKQETAAHNPLVHARGKGSGVTAASSIHAGGYQAQRAEAPVSTTTSHMSSANLDSYEEYMTTTTDGSDVESYIEKRRRKPKDDEGLLFREGGYGNSTSGLPGLFDNDDNGINHHTIHDENVSSMAPIWPSSLRHPATKSRQASVGLPRPRTAGPSTTNSHPPLPPIPSWDFAGKKPLKSSVSTTSSYRHYHSGENDDSSSILSGSSAYDALELEMDGQLDAKLAVRLRKEMKRRERAMTTLGARQRAPGKPKWESPEQINNS